MFLWKPENSINTYRFCNDLGKLKEYIKNWYKKYASSLLKDTNFIFNNIEPGIIEVNLNGRLYDNVKMGYILEIKEIGE